MPSVPPTLLCPACNGTYRWDQGDTKDGVLTPRICTWCTDGVITREKYKQFLMWTTSHGKEPK